MDDDLDDDDMLDGCEIDFKEHADDELTASLRPLFPDGDPATHPEWVALKEAGALDGP